MNEIILKPIGRIHTAFHTQEEMPVQPCGGMEHIGEAVVDEVYQEGLQDLEGFSHIYLIYYFHKTKEEKLTVIPFNDKSHSQRGVFATRTPVHPNRLGLSLVKVLEVKENKVIYQGVDILDGTPLIDIKPYIKNFDHIEGDVRSGWMQASLCEVKGKKSDCRFVEC